MKIELEEYYRTKNGKIHKWSKGTTYIGNNEIVKHSKNIVDLVEVGDYVNGYRVEQVSIETNEVLLDHNGFVWRTLKDGDKIVTHEQFSSIEYKVESEEK